MNNGLRAGNLERLDDDTQTFWSQLFSVDRLVEQSICNLLPESRNFGLGNTTYGLIALSMGLRSPVIDDFAKPDLAAGRLFQLTSSPP